MAIGHSCSAFDHFWRRRRLGQVGEPDDQTAAALQRKQMLGREQMVGFVGLSMNLRHTLHQCAEVRDATSGGHPLLWPPTIREQRHAITRIERDLRKAQSRIDRVIELRQPVDLRPQQAPRIEHKPNDLAALDLMHFGDELSAACCSAPGNVSEFVAFAVITQAFELAPLAGLPLQAFFQFNLAATDEIDPYLLRLLDIGVHTNHLCESCAPPSFSQAERALIPQPYVSERRIAARARTNRVRRTPRATRRCGNLDRGQLATKCRRCFIPNPSANRRARSIVQFDSDAPRFR